MIEGRVWKYGDDVNTDVIFPGRYLTITDPHKMAEHALEDLDPAFRKEAREGDVIVAGRNFGCGSSREQAVTCLKHTGISAIVARSFARIFFRNAINSGLPAIVCEEASKEVEKGDMVEIDLQSGVLRVKRMSKPLKFEPLPPFMMEILMDGGLIQHLKKKIE